MSTLAVNTSQVRRQDADPWHGREPMQPWHGESRNPIGLNGLEFIEYATSRPQALGQVLEMMGFYLVARHRSREVLLYRQGGMNVVVNAHGVEAPVAGQRGDAPVLSAMALRVRDARAAWRHVLERGAWEVPTRAEVMELHLPAIHGPGGSRIHFVDRYRDFSIYDVDFVPVPGVDPRPPAIADLHFFGVVQYIGPGRGHDWTEYYGELLGTQPLPDERRFGIMPKGKLLRAPALDDDQHFMLQLIEPEPELSDTGERLQRIGLGVPDVLAAVQALRARGVEFIETDAVHPGPRGALTRTYLGAVVFELVHSARAVA